MHLIIYSAYLQCANKTSVEQNQHDIPRNSVPAPLMTWVQLWSMQFNSRGPSNSLVLTYSNSISTTTVVTTYYIIYTMYG